MVDVDDAEAIAGAVLRLRDDTELARSLATVGRVTAEGYAYVQLDPAWDALLAQLVASDG